MFAQRLKSMKSWLVRIQPSLLVAILMATSNLQALAEEVGVTSSTIRIGGVMALEGDDKGLGLGMKTGISAALDGEKIQNRAVEFIVLNDFYNPTDTVKSTRQLIDQGIFLMLGNVGTPTTKAALPILVENNVPAVGFFTGSDILRPGVGDIVNFRASYVQEILEIVEVAFSAGVQPKEVCAYVQNDSYGMAGLLGLKIVMEKQPGTADTVHKLEQILAMRGEKSNPNGIGPVGLYQRGTNLAREGYLSLKQWEQATGARCRLVVTVGTHDPVASFISYARYKDENWVFSVISFTGADDLRKVLKNQNITDKVILTSVVPNLDSPLPIVEEARKALGNKLNYISLEGFIVGKMFLAIARNIKGEITRKNFLKAVRGQTFDLGGLKLDFTTSNQGSNLVQLASLDNGEFKSITHQQLTKAFQK